MTRTLLSAFAVAVLTLATLTPAAQAQTCPDMSGLPQTVAGCVAMVTATTGWASAFAGWATTSVAGYPAQVAPYVVQEHDKTTTYAEIVAHQAVDDAFDAEAWVFCFARLGTCGPVPLPFVPPLPNLGPLPLPPPPPPPPFLP